MERRLTRLLQTKQWVGHCADETINRVNRQFPGAKLYPMPRTGLLSKGALLLCALTLSADTLGFVEQKFSYVSFDHGAWDRTAQLPCYVYTARQDGATVEVMRIGSSNLVPFTAARGLTVTICGSTAAFDEGFEAGTPIAGSSRRR